MGALGCFLFPHRAIVTTIVLVLFLLCCPIGGGYCVSFNGCSSENEKNLYSGREALTGFTAYVQRTLELSELVGGSMKLGGYKAEKDLLRALGYPILGENGIHIDDFHEAIKQVDSRRRATYVVIHSKCIRMEVSHPAAVVSEFKATERGKGVWPAIVIGRQNGYDGKVAQVVARNEEGENLDILFTLSEKYLSEFLDSDPEGAPLRYYSQYQGQEQHGGSSLAVHPRVWIPDTIPLDDVNACKAYVAGPAVYRGNEGPLGSIGFTRSNVLAVEFNVDPKAHEGNGAIILRVHLKQIKLTDSDPALMRFRSHQSPLQQSKKVEKKKKKGKEDVSVEEEAGDDASTNQNRSSGGGGGGFKKLFSKMRRKSEN